MFLRPKFSLLSLNYKHVFIVYGLLFFGLTSPFILFGEVIAPHRQYVEIRAVEANLESGHIQNRFFSDYTNGYIPEVSQNLNGARSGWITLWTNQNELGRPTFQGAFSQAYSLSWAFAQLTNNPWRFITALSLFNCFFAGFFAILFCREIGLSPLAGLIAGTSLAASPYFMFWLTYPMYLAVWCWVMGVLWAVTRLAKKPDSLGWSTLAFSTYSLLMTAYPQLVVFYAYILTAYGMYLVYRKQKNGKLEAIRFSLLAISALIVGAVLALPMYLDLIQITAESARVAADPSYFMLYLPNFATLLDAWKYLVLSTMPELFGNPVDVAFPFGYPIEVTFPFSFYSVSVTPVVIFFALIGLVTSFRKSWGWWLAIMVICLLFSVHPLYALGIKYFGFNLSRALPLVIIILPLTIIVAYGVDALVKRVHPREFSRVVWGSAASTLVFIAIGLGFGLNQAIPIHWGVVLAMLFVVGLLAAQHQKTRPILLIAALVTVLATISYPLMLRQDPAQIATTSPLVENMRANLPAGSRFAIAAPGMNILPPNLNAGLGLASVHSFNSLSPTSYHGLIKALGGTLKTYGRWNREISPDYNSPIFWMSNIGLILSPTRLTHENLDYLGSVSGVHLHKVISRMGDSLQIIPPQSIDLSADHLNFVDLRDWPAIHPSKLLDQGDVLEFEVATEKPSIFVLSQKYYRDWQAQVFNQAGWLPAETVLINGVFQGVRLPQNVQRVRMEYRPYVRYAWIAHVFWLLLLAFLGYKAWLKKWRLKQE